MFVQIIEGRTSDPKALMEHGDAWQDGGEAGRHRVPRRHRRCHRRRTDDRHRPVRGRGVGPRQQRAARADGVVRGHGEAVRRRTELHRVDRHDRVDGRRLRRGRLRPGDEVHRRRPCPGREDGRGVRALRRPPPRPPRRAPGLDRAGRLRRRRLLHERGRGPQGREGRDARRAQGAMGEFEGMGETEYFDLTEPQLR